jgi:phage gp36-like protein
VARAIADADEEIDGYLQSRCVVPVSPVPGIIRKISVDIAIYNLYSRRLDQVPESRRQRHENALRFLGKVAEGKIGLGANDPDGNPPADSTIGVANATDRTITSDKLERF